jgi:hypothetical protein
VHDFRNFSCDLVFEVSNLASLNLTFVMAGGLNNLLRSALRANLVVQQVRFYPRWSHRRPVKVHTPEEYEKVEKKSQSKGGAETVFDKYGGLKTTWNKPKEEEEGTDKPIKYKIKSKKVGKSLVATYQKSEVKSNPDMLETVIDGEGNFVYSKMKDNDQRVGYVWFLRSRVFCNVGF